MASNVTEHHIETDMDVENTVMNHNIESNHLLDEEPNVDENAANEFTLVDPHRLRFIGHDKSKGKRVWVQTEQDPTKYNLYSFDEEKDGLDYFKCIQCTRYAHRHHIISIIKVSQQDDGNLEMWEKKNHYPSCNHDKSHIDKIQRKYHRFSGVMHKNAALQGTSTGTSRSSKKSSISSRSRPSKKRGSTSSISKSTPSNSDPRDISTFVSDSPGKAQQRSRTQGMSFSSTVDRGFSRQGSVAPQGSVASTFSHLVPSLQTISSTNTVTRLSPNNKNKTVVVTSSTKRQLSALLRSSRATTVPPQLSIPKTVQRQKASKSFEIQRFKPKKLSRNESLYHCIPSTHEFREMLAILGIEFQPTCQKFWHSSYRVNEIHAISIPTIIRDMGPERNFGYQAFCLFLTSGEDESLQIQESVKRYIYKNYFNPAAQELQSYNSLMHSALCSFNLEEIHLWALAKILNVRIVVFDDSREVFVFGDTFNNSIPSILLRKRGELFWPVMNVAIDYRIARNF